LRFLQSFGLIILTIFKKRKQEFRSVRDAREGEREEREVREKSDIYIFFLSDKFILFNDLNFLNKGILDILARFCYCLTEEFFCFLTIQQKNKYLG
jgi:hypothetical protein